MLLGLDIGDERTGVAFADEALRIPLIHGVLEKEPEAAVLALIEERSVSTIVIGLPLNEDGSEGSQCKKVRAFAKRLGKRTKARIVFVDEYGSSEEAIESIRSMGRRIKDKGEVDAQSAAIILQRYLDRGGIS